MKTKILIGALVLLLGVCFYSCKPSDEKLQTQVTTALSAVPGINGTVKDAVVTLTGVVESDEVKAQAETLVKAVKSIKSVVNNIEVKKPEPPVVINPDDELKTLINNGLTAAGFTDLKIDIKEGEITLNGDVKKADLQKVMQIVNESKPKKVINNLTIK